MANTRMLCLGHEAAAQLRYYSAGAWALFSPQPSWTGAVHAGAVFSTLNGTIVVWDGAQFEHYSEATGTWSHKEICAVPTDIHGPGTEDDIWALIGSSAWHWNGTAWSLHTAGLTGSPRAIHAASATCVLVAGDQLHRWNGASWTDQAAKILADTGIAWSGGSTGAISATATAIYIAANSSPGRILKYTLETNTYSWLDWRGGAVTVAPRALYVVSDAEMWAVNDAWKDIGVWHLSGGTWTQDDAFDGGYPVANSNRYMNGHKGGLEVFAAHPWTAPWQTHQTLDHGVTWGDISWPDANPGWYFAPWYREEVPPTVEHESPADGSRWKQPRPQIEFDALDLGGSGIAVAATVVTVDGETAWTGDAAAAGWSGFRTAITNGYHYVLRRNVWSQPSTRTEVIASVADLAGNTASKTWHFTEWGADERSQQYIPMMKDLLPPGVFRG